MPGARARGFRFGDSAELLAEFILGSMAFTTRVPRQEDVGHDLLCVLAERTGNLLTAGPFFTVQVKNKREEIVYDKEYEVTWIKNQENPFFVCVVDRENLTVELYSTWNMWNGFLFKKANRIVLVPGGPDDEYQKVWTCEDRTKQVVPLGRPILRISAKDVMNEEQVQSFGAILREWVEMDRENIVNRLAGMYWVVGPIHYETNRPLTETPGWSVAFYWNVKNLPMCLRNFGRSATALRLVVRKALGPDGEAALGWAQKIDGLERVLRSHFDHLEPIAKDVLCKEVGLVVDKPDRSPE